MQGSDRSGLSDLEEPGYFFALFGPLIGLFIGIAVGIRHRPPAKNHGPWIITLSLVMSVVWVVALVVLFGL